MGGVHEYEGDQVVADAARHLKHQREKDQCEDERTARQVVDRAADHGDRALASPDHVLVSKKLVGVVVEGWAVQRAFQAVGHHRSGGCTEGPHEHQGFGRDERDEGRRDAGEDVADARARSDDREDPLAFEQVEVLADEAPELEHHQLEADRVDDVRAERNVRGLVEQVEDEDRKRRQAVEGKDHAEGAAHAEPSGHGALERDHRPHGQRQDDEKERIGLRPGFVEEDGLRAAECGVRRPADDDGEAGDLERAGELGAPDVEELRKQRHLAKLCREGG